MIKEALPSFEWQPNHEAIKYQKGEIYARVALPYSNTLHFLNLDRHNFIWEKFRKTGKFPKANDDDFPWDERDEYDNPMPGNITDEAVWAVNFTLPILRLENIKQLAFLAYSQEGEHNLYTPGVEFSHTRLLHSLLVAKISQLIAQRNGFSKKTQNLLEISMLIHDMGTPAGGDPIKELDPEVLDEEVQIIGMLEKYDLTPLEKLGFSNKKAIEIIQGKGLLGNIGDIADKIAYTAVDVSRFAGDHNEPDLGLARTTTEPIRAILREDPNWADIYREVKISDDKRVYFENPERLGRFLELRARMHKALYLNPHNRGRDMLLKMLTAPLYSRENSSNVPLNPETLISMGDQTLSRIVTKHWVKGFPNDLGWLLCMLPDYVQVASEDEVKEKDRSLVESGIEPIAAETIRKFNPGTSFLSQNPNGGKIEPYAEINPEHSRILEEIVNECNRTVIYYWPADLSRYDRSDFALRKLFSGIVQRLRKKEGKLPHYQLY